MHGEFAGQTSGPMKSGVSCRSSSMVSRARCAGALSCWNMKTYAEYLATSAASFDLTSCLVSLRGILLAEYKFQQIVRSWYSVQVTFVCITLCKNLFKKQSAKFVQNPLKFTEVMAKHHFGVFLCPTVYNVAYSCRKQVSFQMATEIIVRINVPDASRKFHAARPATLNKLSLLSC